MTDEEAESPRMLASRPMSWPALALAGLGFVGALAESVDELCRNLITVVGMHLNHTYDQQDAQRADDPFIRTD